MGKEVGGSMEVGVEGGRGYGGGCEGREGVWRWVWGEGGGMEVGVGGGGKER